MKTILVATDFSPAASNAVNYAVDMAVSIHADLVLLHVIQVPVSYSDIPVVITQEELLRNTENEMGGLKEKLEWYTKGKLNIQTEVRMGGFFHELKDFCEKILPYTVVMGSQGTTAAERLLLGGHTIHTMKHLSWPLITVPPDAKFSNVKKIGLACDFDHVVETTPIDEIRMLVTDFNAELHVLNTGKEQVFDPNVVFESGQLQEMLENLNPQYHFITHENADAGIMDFAEKNGIDLLLVLPKRHSLMDSLIHRSHSKQLILHSHVPVMALHH
jgi:nucleotide-binding universal stress UspA family protein